MSQLERLRGHAKRGLSKAQAADIEGVSHSVAANALKGTDLKWADKVTHWNPVGTNADRMSSLHWILRSELEQLRLNYPSDEVCRMTGMNLGEQAHAMNAPKGYSYNWTVGQIARLAAATGTTPLELLQKAVTAMEGRV